MTLRWDERGEPDRGTKLLWAGLLSALASALVFPFDPRISAWVSGLAVDEPGPSFLLRLVKSFGKTDILVTMLLLACLTRQRRAGVAGLVALALVALPALLLKEVVQRPRPEYSGYSFPSGDAASASAALLPLALALGSRGAWVGAVVLAVAAGRVALGFHYPSDVLAGIALGAPAAWASLRFTPRAWRRPRSRGVLIAFTLALFACGLIAWKSAGAPAFPAFFVTLLPVGLLVVARERAWLARRFARWPGKGSVLPGLPRNEARQLEGAPARDVRPWSS